MKQNGTLGFNEERNGGLEDASLGAAKMSGRLESEQAFLLFILVPNRLQREPLPNFPPPPVDMSAFIDST